MDVPQAVSYTKYYSDKSLQELVENYLNFYVFVNNADI